MEHGARNREETGYGDKQQGSQSYSTLWWLISPHLCTLWVDQPAPALPAALSLQLSVTGPGVRGGGKVTPIWYSRISLVWDGGVGGHVSLCISDKTALPMMTLYPLGIACFLCLIEMGRRLYFFWGIYIFHITMQFLSWFNGAMNPW